MFGWEFPPYMSGGLGTACSGLTGALTGFGHPVLFVIPHCDPAEEASHVSLISASGFPLLETDLACPALKNPDVRTVDSLLMPYTGDHRYRERLKRRNDPEGTGKSSGTLSFDLSGNYGPDLMQEVRRFGMVAGAVARRHSFDIIHAHDWMTVHAGLYAREISGKPLILHIHSLEFDRSGNRIDPAIYDMERHGMRAADHVIAVSQYTKEMIVEHYGIDRRKISVVYNAATRHPDSITRFDQSSGRGEIKTVLFLGRITFQKGPEYFIEAAARVLKVFPEVRFIMAGSGDLMNLMIERVAELGIGQNFHFTGFLRGSDVERIFARSDLYVMPSVSEPFGIAPLEALLCDVPVIISKQSGVSEILHHALKVNFWDIDEMADNMIAVLKYPALVKEMMLRASEEIKRIRWQNSAARVIGIYRRVLAAAGPT